MLSCFPPLPLWYKLVETRTAMQSHNIINIQVLSWNTPEPWIIAILLHHKLWWLITNINCRSVTLLLAVPSSPRADHLLGFSGWWKLFDTNCKQSKQKWVEKTGEINMWPIFLSWCVCTCVYRYLLSSWVHTHWYDSIKTWSNNK